MVESTAKIEDLREEYAERPQALERENALYRNLIEFTRAPQPLHADMRTRTLEVCAELQGGRIARPPSSFGKWFQSVFNNTSDGILFTDITEKGRLRFVGCNPAAERLTGICSEEAAGRLILELEPPSLAAFLTRNLGLCLEYGAQLHRDDAVDLAPGKRNVRITMFPLRNATGHIDGITSIIRDITDHKEAEGLLLAREREFRTLAEHSPDVIIRYDRDCRRTYLNAAHERASGRPAEDFLGKTPTEVSAIGAVAPVLQEMIQRVLDAGAPMEADLDGFTMKGELLCYSFRIIPEFDQDGTILGALSVARDITERWLAEKELRKNEARLRRRLDILLSPDTEIDNGDLADLLSAPAVQSLIDVFVELTGAAIGIIDLNGSILVSAGWQDICTRFHRAHPEARMNCVESDTHLTSKIKEGEFRVYRCKNNMWDVATPLFIAGRHVANLFTGQFFFEDEFIDATAFLAQAQRYGFDCGDYREAVARVPRFSREKVDSVMDFLVKLARLISGLGCSNLKLSKALAEQKAAEEALRERESLLSTLLEAVPVPLFYKDAQGRYVGCNTAFESFYGMDKAGLIGKSVFDLNPRDLAEVYHGMDSALIKGGGAQCYEAQVLSKGQGLRDVILHKAAFTGVDGAVRGVVGAILDITERKRAEEALYAREQEFRTLAENNPDVIIRYDCGCRRTFVNAAGQRVLNLPSQELIGSSPADHPVLGQAAERFQEKLQAVLRTGVTAEFDLDWTLPIGETRCYTYQIIAEHDRDNVIVSALAVAKDVTECKKAHAELLASRGRLADMVAWKNTIINVPAVAILVVTKQRIITEVNTGLVEMFGYEPEELLGQSVEMLHVNHEMCKEFGEKYWSGTSTERVVSIEWRVRRKSGEVFWCKLNGSAINQQDLSNGVVWVLLDITERKRIEETLNRREQEYRTVVDNSPCTISRFDDQCRRIFVNPELLRQSGVSPERLLGKTPEEFPGGSDGAMYTAQLQRALQGEPGIEFELEWLNPKGQEYTTLIRLTPEYNQRQEIVSILSVGHDVTEINRSRRKIHDLAFFDILTGLPNRALFNDRSRQALVEAGWHGHLVGLMLLDLDQFKLINDSMGHAAGDELLREVAARLRDCMRVYDTVARLGGDEFVILLPEVRSVDDVGVIAGKIMATFASPFTIEGREIFVSTSLGIAMYPYDETEIEGLLRYADTALYHAKATGRDNFQFYSEELTARARDRLALENDLRRCLGQEELELFYQPKIDLATQAVVGAEALLRWNHPRLGLVTPDRFISIAEDKGLIVGIGEWVLQDAFRTARRWNEASPRPHKIAVNLSARQFHGADLVGTVRRVLAETGCRPEWIELEITESLLLDNHKAVKLSLEAFRDMGFSIALDDFGTGYSAMGYLIRFPISTLKIDRSFILNLVTDQNSSALVRAIASLAHSLRMTLVAEGVETDEQAELLKEIGCAMVQGYLYGKPMPQKHFEEMLELG